MSGWGYDDGGEAEATPDAWGAAPRTTRPAVVSNLRDSAVGALFSPDEPSPNEWSGAGAGGRWGDGDGHEDREDGDDAGGWGGDETFGDGDEAHDWGRSDVGDDDGMSVGAADDDAADGGWGLAEDEDHPPRPVATDAVAGSNERTDRSDRSERRFASNGDDARRLADLADKENAEASKRRRTSLLGAAAAAAAPAPPRRMHGWKSNWAVEGMAQAKANSLSAPSARETTTRETSPARRGSPPERNKEKESPSAGALDSEARETAKEFSPRRDASDSFAADKAAASAETEGADADADAETGRRAVSAWGSDCDSEDELLAGSGLTSVKVQPSSPGAERRRAASLRAAVAARRPFELGAPPGGAPGAGAAAPAREIPAASDSSDDDFGIAVSTRGRGKKKAATKNKAAPKPATARAAKMKPAPATDAPRAFVPRGTVDLVDSDDDFDVVPESDAEADETDGLAGDRERDRDNRAAGRDVDPPEYRGVGGPMSLLPRAPAPAPPAAWRRRLPHFTPASELTKGEYRDGEKVFIDYARQFDGGGGDAHSGGGGRWFREAGANKFVDADGEVLEGRAAWRASEREKKNAAAAARSRR